MKGEYGDGGYLALRERTYLREWKSSKGFDSFGASVC
jgi:hypothetical protein